VALSGHGEVLKGKRNIQRNFSYIKSNYFDYPDLATNSQNNSPQRRRDFLQKTALRLLWLRNDKIVLLRIRH